MTIRMTRKDLAQNKGKTSHRQAIRKAMKRYRGRMALHKLLFEVIASIEGKEETKHDQT